MCCLDFAGQTTSSEIFNALNTFMETHGSDWGKCVGVCMDGTACMTGYHSSVIAKIKGVVQSDILYTHCIIHREHLAAKKKKKKLSSNLNVVLNFMMKMDK